MNAKIVDEEERLWLELDKATKIRDRAIKDYNKKRNLESIEKMNLVCNEFNKTLELWRKASDKKVREHSVYIPAQK